MNGYVFRVSGAVHCPQGISRPDNAEQWEDGCVLIPGIGPLTGSKQKAPLPVTGDEAWIWTNTSKEWGNGFGLTAHATIGDVVQQDSHIAIRITNVALLAPYLRLEQFEKSASGSVVIDAMNDTRWPVAIYLGNREAQDHVDFLRVIDAMRSPIMNGPIIGEYPHGDDDWCWFLLAEKAAILDSFSERREVPVALRRTRPGYAAFRAGQILRHNGRCVITQCWIEETLEAAHVIAHSGDPIWERPENGVLLRRDLHSLFDAQLLSVHPETSRVHVSPHLLDSDYGALHGKWVNHRIARHPLGVHFRQFLKHRRTRSA